MESARKYTAIQARSSRQLYSGVVISGKAGQGKANQLFNKDVKQGDKKNKGFSLMDQFTSMQGVNKISSRDIGSELSKIREQCISYIYELLFGRERNGSGREDFKSFDEWKSEKQSQPAHFFVETMEYETEFSYSEEETTSFSTTGTVKTADGREINFNMDVEMSRSFSMHYKEQYKVQSVRVCDPLVINLDTNIAGLSDQKFFFDLDADGTEEEISMLQAGSGYLALDKNHDGRINDGSELFGAKSGNGFADLAQYDDDGDGWIDEDDAIWNQLKIWCKDESGRDSLYKLSDKGVGAICLQNVSTQYSLNSQKSNETNGYIRSTGIFLYENGSAGSVQHVDVATGFAAKG